MRVLVVCRLFSGFKETLSTRNWQPKGVPAIFKLLEQLSNKPDIELLTVFINKDKSFSDYNHYQSFELPPIGRVNIVPWLNIPVLKWLGLEGKFNELFHLLFCLWKYPAFRPEVAYFTNANIIAAAVYSRFGLCRTIFRFLGLHPIQHAISEKQTGMFNWLYKSPFEHVICTLDGSGVNYYLPKLINNNVSRDILLNGVDEVESKINSDIAQGFFKQDNKILVLFVGRLEENKGCIEFVDAMLNVLEKSRNVKAALIGDGSLRESLQDKITAGNAEADIHLTGSITHDRVTELLGLADIYVSLNYYGNLSNANLEAMAAGKCMIILDRDENSHIDHETSELIPVNTLVRIKRDSITENLAHELQSLIKQPEMINKYSLLVKKFANENITSWNIRVEKEISIITGTEIN